MKEKKSTFSWIFSFAGQKKSGYIASVILAVIGAAFQILPFFVMAQVIGKLLAGNKDLAGYLIDCAVMAAFWLWIPQRFGWKARDRSRASGYSQKDLRKISRR